MRNLTTDDCIRIFRLLPECVSRDESGMPIIKKTDISLLSSGSIKLINYEKIHKAECVSNCIVDMFCNDAILERIWNDPMRHMLALKSFAGVCTSDFTICSGMDPIMIKHNVYRNRYVGCLWQFYGVNVIPTIQWADKSTFDVAFSGIEEGGHGCRFDIGVYVE